MKLCGYTCDSKNEVILEEGNYETSVLSIISRVSPMCTRMHGAILSLLNSAALDYSHEFKHHHLLAFHVHISFIVYTETILQ